MYSFEETRNCSKNQSSSLFLMVANESYYYTLRNIEDLSFYQMRPEPSLWVKFGQFLTIKKCQKRLEPMFLLHSPNFGLSPSPHFWWDDTVMSWLRLKISKNMFWNVLCEYSRDLFVTPLNEIIALDVAHFLMWSFRIV